MENTITEQEDTRYDQFCDAIRGDCDDWHGPPLYTDDQLRALWKALRAKTDADIEQLTCCVCGLSEWQSKADAFVDLARDSAAESDGAYNGDLEDRESLTAWYVETHSCDYHSPFQRPLHGSFDAQEEHEHMMAAIEAAIRG